MAVAIRDRIKEKAQPLLEPGEMIQAVIPAQTKNGWLGALGIVWLIFTNRYRPIVVTDRRIAITDSGKWAMAKPNAGNEDWSTAASPEEIYCSPQKTRP